MKKSIIYILFAAFALLAASLTACKDDGVEISGANKSKVPKNVKLLEYSGQSLTICWDFIRSATSYTVQLVDGEMNPISEALCKTTDNIDYHEFTNLPADQVYYGRVRANFPYSSTSDWVYVVKDDKPAMLMAGVGIIDVDPQIRLYAATGSTLTFEWSYTEDKATDAQRRYNVELFRDEACSDLFVSWIADGKLTSDKGIFTNLVGYPVVRFTFSGLDPETTYYARVTNTNFGNIMTPVAEGTTKTAGPQAAANSPVKAGDIVLAQDFAKFIHGGDIVNSSAGYNALASSDYRKTWEVATGENPVDEGKRPVVAWGTEFGVWAADVSDDYREVLGMTGWGLSGNVSTRPGYVKCGGGSGAVGILYTPELAALPANTTVTVNFSASAYAEGSNVYGSDIVVEAIEGAEFGANHAVSKKGTAVASKVVDISAAVGEFGAFSVTLEGLSPTSRIAFSSNPAQTSANKTRFLLDDIVITYVGESSLEKLPVPQNVKFDTEAVYADKLTLKWDEVEGAASYAVAWWGEGTQEADATVETGLTAASWLLKDLEAQTKYFAKVKACRYNNPDSDSDYSATVSQSTSDAPQQAGIVVSKVKATSSTLTVEWARVDGEPLVNNASQVYYTAIYNDAACEQLIVGWDASNVFGISAGTRFRFTFSGLAPATTYYVRVNDKTNDFFSDPMPYTTAAAGPQANATTPGSAKAGSVLIGEEFSKLIHCGDIANFAAAYSVPAASRATYLKASGDNPTGFTLNTCTAGEFDLFSGGSVTAAYTEGTGLSAWGKSGNIATRSGYVKMGTGSAAASLYTPELKALPDASTVKVRFSAQAYSEKYDGSGADAGKIEVKAVRGAELGAKGAISGTVTEVATAPSVDISAAKAEFRDFEVTLQNVTPDCRIVISTTEKRALLDNIVITCEAVTPGAKPDAPTGVLFDTAATTADKLTVKWNAVSEAVSYTIAYWKGSADADESQYSYKTDIAATATSQELFNLSSNTTYWAKVKAVGGADSDWSQTASATTSDGGPEPLLPKADLLDIEFRNDGTAVDNSPMGIPVQTVDGTAMMTYYNDLYSKYVAHFNHTPGETVKEGFYKADYSANVQFQNALADGHTIEAVFKVDQKSDGSKELKMFASHSSGGTGFVISTASRGTQLTFLPNVSTTGKSSWVWTQSGINPEAGRYYHVVGVWNKEENKSYIYVDGELKGTANTSGNYVPPTTTTSYWFGIGADASATDGQNAWKGDVALARIYDAPLTAEKVQALWETVKRDQQPSAISITDLLYLSGCEVGANYRYTLYGNGFAAGDKIKFESISDTSTSFTCDGSVSAGTISIIIPGGFTSDRYRMVLMRGQNQYPLGITQLTMSNNPRKVTKPGVVAHRGYHTTGAAQNSVAALAKAQELGVYGSEFDVWVTADGRVVINHDKSVPGSSLVIENVNYDQIKDLTLANGEKLPTLEDYLEQGLKNRNVKLILEIKRHSTAANNERAVDAVVAAVKAKGMTDQVEYLGFDYATCKRLAQALPGAMVQYLNGDRSPASMYADGIRGIDYTFAQYSANPGWIAEAKNKGMVTNIWTINSLQDMMTCIAWGMDFITTNNPDILKDLAAKTFVSTMSFGDNGNPGEDTNENNYGNY
ncbi:glycerophosphodiester phosphodiesterase family protein [uncultured Alistipes sp.]|uniref:glycerophosphodiester phosphodiesterase family protein n=1 Tax=uncultured Alistipes sp. TaxID=538949 RepID=UPI0025EBD2D8|nr:glycerophosphodiester phosphodiesterase family protein [uncultured Alistipes sp.]